MSAASGLEHLKPFLPGLESALEDSEVSEIMINGPGNVWVERAGRLAAHAAPDLDEAALLRAAIHIARPLGLDPASSPIVDARLDDGSRVAICVPPASPQVAITVRRFGKRAFSADDLVKQGALPENVRAEAERVLRSRRNILVSGGTGSGKTTLLNALIELLPDDERIVAIEDTLELRIERSNCVRFEARGLQEGAVTIRDLVRHALRHRPDHIVVGEVRGGEAADLLQALNTGHGGSLTTVHANNAESALSRIASCAMQGGGELPVGGHLPGRSGRHRHGDSHDAPRGAAIRRRSGFRQRLRSEKQPMGHSKNRGRRRLTLPLPLRAKMIGLAMFVGGFMGLITSAQLDPISARVERVIDGDTIHVRFEGKRYTVRLIGVDTPETKHPTKAVQYFGREASAFTKAALEGKTVMLQKDRTGDTVDRYGRWLRYVLLDGDNFNARLIRDGYAHAYRAQGSVAMDRAALVALSGRGVGCPGDRRRVLADSPCVSRRAGVPRQ